jgi:hypothetical protein
VRDYRTWSPDTEWSRLGPFVGFAETLLNNKDSSLSNLIIILTIEKIFFFGMILMRRNF